MMFTQAERDIVTAPPGMLQVVQVDPTDFGVRREGPPQPSLEAVQEFLGHKIPAEQEVLWVFNDKGERVLL